MTDHNEFFLPAQVDEQIDRLTQQPHTSDSRLIHDLQLVSQDHTEMLDRVGDRLLAHIEQTQRTQTIPLTGTQQHPYERIRPMFPRTTSGEQYKRRQYVLSPLALVAAVIIAVLATGSALAVFQFAHSQQSHNTVVGHSNPHTYPTIAPTPTPTPVPLPASLCNLGNGAWYSVCSTHQQTMIDQTHALGNDQVTLYAGYADNNSIIIAYTIQVTGENSSPNMPPTIFTTLSAQKGVQITESGGTSSGSYDVNNKQFDQIGRTTVLSVADTITTLKLHLSMDDIRHQPASFDFSLPFHRGRNVNINQTQMVNGQPITLDHVSISTSRTLIYIAGTQLNTQMLALDPSFRANGPQAFPYELQIGKWSTHQQTNDVLDATWNQNQDKHQPVLGIQIEVDEPLLNKSRDWTLIIHAEAIPNATQDVIFHFKA